LLREHEEVGAVLVLPTRGVRLEEVEVAIVVPDPCRELTCLRELTTRLCRRGGDRRRSHGRRRSCRRRICGSRSWRRRYRRLGGRIACRRIAALGGRRRGGLAPRRPRRTPPR